MNDTGKYRGWQSMTDYQNWLLLRRMRSRRQVLEVMTEFWENHFNVPVSADGVYTWRVRYGDAIRARALHSFESTAPGRERPPGHGHVPRATRSPTRTIPNENQGRELLELHTVGLGAGYSEHDVVNSARILTGWQVKMWDTWDAGYNDIAHYTGKVRVLGFHDHNSRANGVALTRRYLRYLAHHPPTASHIATQLATAFVSDQPSRGLVRHLAHVYLAHGTQIRPVLRALVDSAEFKHSVGQVIRDPENDLVATFRLMNAHVGKPKAPDDTAHQLVYFADQMGQAPMAWPAPNGRRSSGGVELALAGDGLHGGALQHGQPVVAHASGSTTRSRRPGCPASPCASTTWSTTWRSASCTGTPTSTCTRRAVRRSRSRVTT